MDMLDVGQANELKLACRRNNVTPEDIKWLCEGDILAEIPKLRLDHATIVDRQRFDHIKALAEAMVLQLKSVPTPDTIIHVNHSIKPAYPDRMEKVMHPELEATGPAEYDLATVELWLHGDQKGGNWIKGQCIYDHLKETDTLKTCLGLRDLEEIQKKGIAFFRKHFADKAVFGWKSVVQDRDGNLLVPCLIERSGGVVVHWSWLVSDWSGHNPAARFAS